MRPTHRSRTRSRASLPFLAVAAVLSAPAVPLAAPAPRVRATSASEKVLPGAPAQTLTVPRISAAKNEFEAFQVVVTGRARGVSARVSKAPAGPGGTIGDVRLYREALITLQRASAPDGGTGPWPDALVPDVDEVEDEPRNAFPFDVRAGDSRAIWVEVFVPASAAAGTYRGEIAVTWSGGAATVPFDLVVWDFALPSTSSVRTAYGMAWGALPTAHGFSSSDLTTFSTLRARYGRFALDHRISISRHDDGAWMDLDHFDTWYGPLMDGTAPTRLAGARQTSVEYLGALDDVTNMTRWADHYSARGWLDRLFQYTCDEPPRQCAWTDIASRAAAAKAANAAFRTLVTTTIQSASANGVAGSIDLLVPVVNFMDDKSGGYAGDQRTAYDAFLDPASGNADGLNEVWMYQSCMSHDCGGSSSYGTGWPSYMIDASAVRNRAMGWMLFRYRATGELYWETAYAYYALNDPWTSQWAFTGNGDGTLFYPGTPARIGGTTDVPVASIRLKMIREGLEDYEYLKLLSDLGGGADARQLASELFPSMSAASQTAAKLLQTRETIARKILERMGKPPPP